jgi:hypothetical protein
MGAAELMLVAAALVLTAITPAGAVVVTVVAALLAIAMGLQNTRRPPARGTGPDHDRTDDDTHRDRRRCTPTTVADVFSCPLVVPQ